MTASWLSTAREDYLRSVLGTARESIQIHTADGCACGCLATAQSVERLALDEIARRTRKAA